MRDTKSGSVEGPDPGRARSGSLCWGYIMSRFLFWNFRSTFVKSISLIVVHSNSNNNTAILFSNRMLPIREGTITIDGININEVSLGKLRDSITIIPQEPILFEGTIRQNLDISGETRKVWIPKSIYKFTVPTLYHEKMTSAVYNQLMTTPGKKTDEQLWTALEIALVKDAVSDMPDGLDTKIVDEGMSSPLRSILLLQDETFIYHWFYSCAVLLIYSVHQEIMSVKDRDSWYVLLELSFGIPGFSF